MRDLKAVVVAILSIVMAAFCLVLFGLILKIIFIPLKFGWHLI